MLDAVGQDAGFGRDVGQLGLQARQSLDERFEPRVHAGDEPSLVQRLGRRLASAARFGGQGVVDQRGAAGDRLTVLGRREPAADLVGLPDPQPGRGDLGRLRAPRARGAARAPAG